MVGQSTVKVLAGNAVFLQAIRVPNYGTNAALWSLANEFWYYMAFPPLLLLFLGKGPIWRKAAHGILAAAILVFVGINVAALFVVWLLGFGVSVLPLRIPARYRQAAIIVSLLQFLAVNAFIRTHAIEMLTADGLLGLSFTLFLYAIVHQRQPIRSIAYQHLATRFAKFSYTLYLVHLPFLTFLTALVITPWQAWPKNPLHLLEAALLVAAAYAYSWVVYLLFERNTEQVRAWITSFLERQPRAQIAQAYVPDVR
jgi:peptidoglycan/LPS O-acetylase OafA/YrhL